MLSTLRIKNVALITQAEIEFCQGLNVLSGETGAGKSVILDSINFVLGAKADKTMIRYGEQFCLVECSFIGLPESVCDILSDYDIEHNGEIVIKRKFDVNGNGYIKLNGETVTAAMLKKVTSLLVDVHGQSEHFTLLNKAKQLECLDISDDIAELKDQLKQITARIKLTDEKIAASGGTPEERARRLEMLEYEINEITAADLKEGEEEDLVSLKSKIANAQKLINAFACAHTALSDENGAADALIVAEQSLKAVAAFDEKYQKLVERLAFAREEINDVSDTVQDYIDNFDIEAYDHDEIEKRLDVYRLLKKKYGASVQAVNEYLQKASSERDMLADYEKKTAALLAEREDLCNSAYALCERLSEKRKQAAQSLSKKVTQKLVQLAMPSARFYVEFEKLPEKNADILYSANGLDKIDFMFSANAGEPCKPLSKIISGGEMSRFMLALKTQASVSSCETFIFDEIDAGISGNTAAVVAENFAEISKNNQIIAISHLPQISAMSDRALKIYKTELDGKTFTNVECLTDGEKVCEIVRLIGGDDSDAIALRHAENMILRADEFKNKLK